MATLIRVAIPANINLVTEKPETLTCLVMFCYRLLQVMFLLCLPTVQSLHVERNPTDSTSTVRAVDVYLKEMQIFVFSVINLT